jgi:hypothetical protein
MIGTAAAIEIALIRFSPASPMGWPKKPMARMLHKAYVARSPIEPRIYGLRSFVQWRAHPMWEMSASARTEAWTCPFFAMEWIPDSAIEHKLYRLIDMDQPLHKDDIFLPSITFSMSEIIWLVFWLFILGGLTVTFFAELIKSMLFTSSVQDSKVMYY